MQLGIVNGRLGALRRPTAAALGRVTAAAAAAHPPTHRRPTAAALGRVTAAAAGARVVAAGARASPKKSKHKRPKGGEGGGGSSGSGGNAGAHASKAGDGAKPGGGASGGGGAATAAQRAAAAAADWEWSGGSAEYDDGDEEDGDEGFLAPHMDAVLKVYCVHTEPNHSMPWQRKRQYPSSSSGFVAANAPERRWLLTNAHSVDYGTQVKVKRRGDDRKFLARVLSVGVDCDIALLTVDDDAFWEGLPAIEFGPLPRLQDTVAVVGYPVGGESISITAGVVSRIEVTEYSHGSCDLLGVQIDAAINGGNSGGPVFSRKGQCVGIAFQALTGADVENCGYVIPVPVVSHFLTDYLRSGGFTGFPSLGVQFQRMESEALRRAYGMAPAQKGVLIRRVNATSHAAAVLRRDDVLLSFDGVAIASDGTVPFRTGERIAFSHLISQKFVGDSAELEVLRGGEVLRLDCKLSRPQPLVPPHLGNADPAYFIVSGLVFVAASEPYLESEYGADYASEAPVKLLDCLYHGQPSSPGEQVVVLSQVLAAPSTLGYEDVTNVRVFAVNGERVRDLAHLAALVAACEGEYLRFDCEYEEALVLDRAAAFADTLTCLEAHAIPAALSAGLRAALPPWPPGAAVPAAAAGEEAAPVVAAAGVGQ